MVSKEETLARCTTKNHCLKADQTVNITQLLPVVRITVKRATLIRKGMNLRLGCGKRSA